jgi:retron-type reverse transcriptase
MTNIQTTKKKINYVDKKPLIQERIKKIEKLSQLLENHTKRNQDTKHINRKVFHLLRDPLIYVNAYLKISKNRGVLTKGCQDDGLITHFGIEQAEILARHITDGIYRFSSAKRTWVPKPGRKKKQPTDVPKQSDRIVHEAIRGILEAIYEPVFHELGIYTNDLSNNYGFRPNLSCWSALDKIKRHSQLCNIVIEGDITFAYNYVDHGILLKILRERISDKKFLKLIKIILESGVMEEEQFEHTILGTPQGGTVSPILFNIYMLGFDFYIYETFISPILEENKKKTKRGIRTAEYRRIELQTKKKLEEYRQLKQINKTQKNQTKETLKTYKQLRAIRNSTQYKRVDTLPKGAVYVRYIGGWVFALTCTEFEAKEIKKKISDFIQNKIKIKLDQEKMTISRTSEGYKFLGFKVQLKRDYGQIRETRSYKKDQYTRILRRTASHVLNITPDTDFIIKRLKLQNMCNNKGMPVANPKWIASSEYGIVTKYNEILREIYNYYKPCGKLQKLHRVSFLLHYSCAKTLARRKKISLRKIFDTYGKSLTIETIKVNGKPLSAKFQDLLSLRKISKKKYLNKCLSLL